jgi:hypothetical protein
MKVTGHPERLKRWMGDIASGARRRRLPDVRASPVSKR